MTGSTSRIVKRNIELPLKPDVEEECRHGDYPDKSGRCGQRRVTPAMAAKLTGHIWKFAELFETVMPAKVAA